MSFNNFKAKIWSKDIQRELERVAVYANDTNQKYSGEIKGVGDTVRIQGVGKPKITMFTNKDRIKLEEAERVEDTSTSLIVDHVATFNYAVHDIDKAQGANGVLPILNTEASEETGNVIDRAIAELSNDKQAKKMTPVEIVGGKDGNALSVLDLALQHLYEMDVNPSTLITVTIPPAFYTRFKQVYTHIDTNNSEYLKNGQIAKYSNAVIRLSNNVAKDKEGHDLIQVKTQRAIALAKSEPHTEPYRPEDGFADAVKGFVLFGTKIVRPKEFINIPVSYK